MRVALARKMQVEERRDARAVERQAFIQAPVFQPLACPGAQRPAQPTVDRHGEALLRPLHDLARQVSIRELAWKLLLAAAANLQGEGQPQAPFDELVVEQRLAR